MKICAYIPQGFSDESKGKFLHGLKQLCCDVYDFPMTGSSCYLHECRAEDVCEDAAQSVFVLFYTTVGKTHDQYEKTGKIIEALCLDCFGEKLKVSVVFREHHKGNIAKNGKLVARM